MTAVHLALERAQRRLVDRLEHLAPRIDTGEEGAWVEYRELAVALATVSAQLRPEAAGRLMTTQEMAGRLSISPKTLLKRKARGEMRPALQVGRLIRWRGNEAAR